MTDSWRIDAQLTGHWTDPWDTTLLGSSHYLDRVQVPRFVESRDDRILWAWESPEYVEMDRKYHGGRRVPRGVRTGEVKGLLDAFLSLSNAEGIARFVKRYGPLELCSHGLPRWHNPRPPWWRYDPSQPGNECKPQVSDKTAWGTIYWEPVAGWLHFVKKARALVAIAIALRDERPGPAGEWQILLKDEFEEGEEDRALWPDIFQTLKRSVELGKHYFCQAVNDWLVNGNVRPLLSWSPSERNSFATLQLSPPTLLAGKAFSALAVQLLTAVSRPHQIFKCDGCGQPYLRKKRKPQAGRHNYCPACGERVANRIRKRQWRATHPKMPTSHKQGRSDL